MKRARNQTGKRSKEQPGASEGRPKDVPLGLESQWDNKIFARNLTARAAYLVAGNPVVTRPEDTVANCFPGLEADIRNLDRRFFPGLVFEFVGQGAKLAYVDALEDPDLDIRYADFENGRPPVDGGDGRPGAHYRQLATKLYADLSDDDLRNALETGDLLPGYPGRPGPKGAWFLDWIEVVRKSGRTANRRGSARRSHRLRMPRAQNSDVSGQVWRLVRSLEPGPVTIGLKLRGVARGQPRYGELTLKGWRRRYTDAKTGVINLAYQPGELGQGLCSPWQHDFRDCQCFYWAAIHPDIVLGELYPGESLPSAGASSAGSLSAAPPGGQSPGELPASPGQASSRPAGGSPGASSSNPEPTVANQPLDWIRSDRSRSLQAGALGTIAANRPYQLDHFQINSAWQSLSIVLEGREIGGVYTPQGIETANPYPIQDIGKILREVLGPLELALVFEYLYAYFSLLDKDEARRKGGSALEGAVMLARQHLILVATSEMQHLHRVNQVLWELTPAGEKFAPALVPACCIPTNLLVVDAQHLARVAQAARAKRRRGARSDDKAGNDIRQAIRSRSLSGIVDRRAAAPSGKCEAGTREAALRCLWPEVIDDFIALEHPSGYIDSAYARGIATLNKMGRPDLAELAMRVAADGVQHEILFREIKAALSPYYPEEPADLANAKRKPARYLRPVQQGSVAAARRAKEPLLAIKKNLNEAYTLAGNGAIERSGTYVAEARNAMTRLLNIGEDLARDGIGIPFFAIWNAQP